MKSKLTNFQQFVGIGSIVSDRDPRLTSGFWRHVFELVGRKLHMSTVDDPQTIGQTERATRVVADVLRTVVTPKMEQTIALRGVRT